MRLSHRAVFSILGSFFLSLLVIAPVLAQTPTPTPVVHAVLFYSPTCPHCAYVINEVLPPLFEKYGGQLQMIGIDVTQPDGQKMFLDALAVFALDRGGVPFLVVGDTYLVGSVDIPEKFPALIDQHLAAGGLDWPKLPGLPELLASLEATQSAPTSTPIPAPRRLTPSPLAASPLPDPTPAPTSTPAPLVLTGETESTLAERLGRDPLGNGAAIVVLLGMLAALGWGAWRFWRAAGRPLSERTFWTALLLCVLGLGVAAYLTYIEVTRTEAFCGPVGDCNAVQQSKYARLFGVLPVGLLGLFGYALMLAALAAQRLFKEILSHLAALTFLALTVFGTLFSVYLTFLEPFVIGATCMWCLTSAIVTAILMLLSISPAKATLTNLAQAFSPPKAD